MSTTPTHPPRPARWYYEMDLGEVPDLSPEELRAIAIRQSYSIAAILALHEDDEFPQDDQDAIVGPVRIDRERIEEWYGHMEREHDVEQVF